MGQTFFDGVETIRYGGPQSRDPLSFRYYDADRVVAGRTMREHLRFAVCWWHSFHWGGTDIFGGPTLDRPWLLPGHDPMQQAHDKADAAFEFFTKLGVDFYTFHDRDVAPEGASFAEAQSNFARMVDVLEAHQSRTGLRLLWGTAALAHNPRYAAGAATNPDPDVFACAATQVADCLDATHRLGGENYVLWGGREGYETLLNTDLRQEREQMARFLALVAEHKEKIGFKGTLLLEPKPFEPTKHQYDFDVAAVHGFLVQFGLEGAYKVNIEANHATLSGHSFPHEVAMAIATGVFGSIDANRGDPQLGWDTDQFPNDVAEAALVMRLILQAGGFDRGGFNFDAKLRRQSVDRVDLFHGHIGGMDTLARGLLIADAMIRDGEFDRLQAVRYGGWGEPEAKAMLAGERSLDAIRGRVRAQGIDPKVRSGRQEYLENLFSRYL